MDETINISDEALHILFGRLASRAHATETTRIGDASSFNDLHHLASQPVLSASRAARCVACHGVRSHAEAVALVIECSIPVV